MNNEKVTKEFTIDGIIHPKDWSGHGIEIEGTHIPAGIIGGLVLQFESLSLEDIRSDNNFETKGPIRIKVSVERD